MDHIFNLLEIHADKLEKIVEERTKELLEEKMRSELLLNQLLPPSVYQKTLYAVLF